MSENFIGVCGHDIRFCECGKDMLKPERTDHLLTKDEVELLDILIEECAEVIKAATKMKRFGKSARHGGVDYDNVRDFSFECGDLECMIAEADRHGLIRHANVRAGFENKMKKLKIFTRNL